MVKSQEQQQLKEQKYYEYSANGPTSLSAKQSQPMHEALKQPVNQDNKTNTINTNQLVSERVSQ